MQRHDEDLLSLERRDLYWNPRVGAYQTIEQTIQQARAERSEFFRQLIALLRPNLRRKDVQLPHAARAKS